MAGWPSFSQTAESGQAEGPVTAETCAPQFEPTPGKLASPRLKLGSIADIKRELARLYREARREEISTQTATRLAYLLNMMAQLIESAELEKRVMALEQPDTKR
jgi:hypothetical protein